MVLDNKDKIGTTVNVLVEKWNIEMVIRDIRVSWGDTQYLVGRAGMGFGWVSSSRIR